MPDEGSHVALRLRPQRWPPALMEERCALDVSPTVAFSHASGLPCLVPRCPCAHDVDEPGVDVSRRGPLDLEVPDLFASQVIFHLGLTRLSVIYETNLLSLGLV